MLKFTALAFRISSTMTVAALLALAFGHVAQADSPPPADGRKQARDELDTLFAADSETEDPPVDTIPVGDEELPEVEAAPAPAVRHIDEIVVTATKREKSLRDIAGSVAALSGQQLEDSGAQDLADYLKLVPGVTLNPLNADQNRIAIRGVAPDGASANLGQTTGSFLGDTPTTDPLLSYVTPDINAFDLKSVEVLKGPQGTLFGGSALNGAIRYIPQPAAVGQREAKAYSMLQSINEGGVGTIHAAALNVPAGAGLAFRVVGVQRDAPGFIDDLRNGRKDVDELQQQSYRGLFQWEPLARTSISGIYLDQKSTSLDLRHADNFDGQLKRENQKGDNHSLTEFSLANVDLRHNFDFATLVSTTSRLTKGYDADVDISRSFDVPTDDESFRGLTFQDVENLVQEFRLVSADGTGGAWEWLGGVFAQRYHQFLISDGYVPIGGNNLSLPTRGVTDLITGGGTASDSPTSLLNSVADVAGRELALFGEASRRFGQRWTVTMGLRLFDIETEGDVTTSGTLLLAGGSPTTRTQAKVSETGVNPKLSAMFDWTENLSLFGQVARGFRFGGVNLIGDTPSDDIPPTYDSDIIWSKELGIRSSWLNRGLQADLTLFHLDWEDTQQQVLTDSGFFAYIVNIGRSRVVGAEAALQWLPPVDGLSLSLNAALIDGRTKEAFETSNGPVPADRRLPNTADLQTTATLAWNKAIGPLNLDASLVHSYFGKAFNDIQHSAEILDYQSLDLGLRAQIQSWAGRPTISAQLSNLTDTRAVVNALVLPSVSDVFYLRPRTLDLKLAIEF